MVLPTILESPLRAQGNLSPYHLATQSSGEGRSSKSADSSSVRKPTRTESSEGRSRESAPAAVALGEAGPSSTRPHSVESQQTIGEDLTQEERDMLELQRLAFEAAKACVRNRNRNSSQHRSNADLRGPQKSIPSMVPEGSKKQEDMGPMHMLADDTTSIASGAPTLAESIGQLALRDATCAVLDIEDDDTAEDVQEILAFVKIPVPLRLARNPEDSPARKGQLTLLFERDRADGGT